MLRQRAQPPTDGHATPSLFCFVVAHPRDAVLLRALARIDAELPLLPPALFGTPSAHPLLAEGALEFSSREPALNVCMPARTATPD